jgi:hypothetical protein
MKEAGSCENPFIQLRRICRTQLYRFFPLSCYKFCENLILVVGLQSEQMAPPTISADADEIKRRAKLIKQRAMFSSAVRTAFIPAVTLYSFFMTRPREGHFHRYIAERRYYDSKFNAQFPRLRGVSPPAAASAATADSSKKSSKIIKKEEAVSDNDRALRRSAMFRRESNLLASDEEADHISTLNLNDLREETMLAEHRASIPEIMAQLRDLSSTTSSPSQNTMTPLHNTTTNNKPQGSSPASPPVTLSFSESIFWSRGELHFAGQETPRRFIGVFGMLWWEL